MLAQRLEMGAQEMLRPSVFKVFPQAVHPVRAVVTAHQAGYPVSL
jgi:hypothetical protein